VSLLQEVLILLGSEDVFFAFYCFETCGLAGRLEGWWSLAGAWLLGLFGASCLFHSSDPATGPLGSGDACLGAERICGSEGSLEFEALFLRGFLNCTHS
jgi:hypothetical protein